MDAKQQRVIQAIRDAERSQETVAIKLRVHFAVQLMARLDELRMSQAELARQTGLSEPYISRVLNSETNWTSKNAARLMDALELVPNLTCRPLRYIDNAMYSGPDNVVQTTSPRTTEVRVDVA